MSFVSLSALALAGAALLASSSAPTPPAPPSPPAPAAAPAATSGMMVFVDPESGALTAIPPTPEAVAELLALESALSRSSEGLIETKASDGSPMINLQGRFQHVSLVSRSAQATHSICTTSSGTARAVVGPTSRPLPAGPEEE